MVLNVKTTLKSITLGATIAWLLGCQPAQ
jgi:hypothetical protein